MVDRLEVDLIVKAMAEGFDKLEKEFGKVVGASEEITRATSEQTKALIKAGESTEGFTTDVIKAEAELEAYAEKARRAKEETKGFGKSTEDAGKGGENLVKQLKGMVKGFLGITGAIVAGRALASFAKDALAAADAAGKLPPIFAEAEKTSNRLKEAVGEQLAGGLEDSKKAFVVLAEPTIKNIELSNRLTDAHRRGIITLQELNRMRTAQKGGQEASARVLQDILILELEHNTARKTGTEILAQAIAEEERLDTIRRARAAEAEITPGVTGAIAARIPGLLKAPVEIVPFFKDLDLNITSQIQTAIDLVDFAQIGGREFVEGFDEIIAAINTRQLSENFSADILDQFFLVSQQMEVALGNIDVSTAAENVRDEFNVPWGEALALVLATTEAIRKLDGLKARAQIIIDIKTKGGPTPSPFAGPQGPMPPGVGPQPGLFGPGPNIFGQSGVSGIVPQGFPNDSFMIGASSGESFDVRTPGQQNAGGNMAEMLTEMAGMRADIKNALLDVGQMIAEAG